MVNISKRKVFLKVRRYNSRKAKFCHVHAYVHTTTINNNFNSNSNKNNRMLRRKIFHYLEKFKMSNCCNQKKYFLKHLQTLNLYRNVLKNEINILKNTEM